MAGIASVSGHSPRPSLLPGDNLSSSIGPVAPNAADSDQSSQGEPLVIDLSNKKIERELVKKSVQVQKQQQSTENTDGGNKTSESSGDSNGATSGKKEDGPPPEPPDLSFLRDPFFQQTGDSTRRQFGFGRGKPFSGPSFTNSSSGLFGDNTLDPFNGDVRFQPDNVVQSLESLALDGAVLTDSADKAAQASSASGPGSSSAASGGPSFPGSGLSGLLPNSDLFALAQLKRMFNLAASLDHFSTPGQSKIDSLV